MQLTGTQKKVAIAISAMLIVLVLLGLWLRPNPNEVTLTITVVPSDGVLTIDGRPATAGKVTLTKAQHNLKATRQNFGDASKTIDAVTVDPTQVIYLVLDPNTDLAKQYMDSHPDEQAARERGIANDVSNRQDALLTKYPVLSYLPHETTDYKIEYTVNEAGDDVSFAVTIYTAYPTPDNQDRVAQQMTDYKKEAQQFLQDNGVDINKASITYTNY